MAFQGFIWTSEAQDGQLVELFIEEGRLLVRAKKPKQVVAGATIFNRVEKIGDHFRVTTEEVAIRNHGFLVPVGELPKGRA